MSILAVTDEAPLWSRYMWGLGQLFVKAAADAEISYNLAGQLYLAKTGFLMLSVPNALARSVFTAMSEPGIELPPGPDGVFTAHITVMRPEEVAVIGGPDKITERGKQFHYTLGRMYSVEPDGWPDVAKVWFIRCHSPELQTLRRSYGLSSLPKDGKIDFHISVAVRRKRVLGRNETKKVAEAVA